MRIKICGITEAKQGRAIAELGATALGFICAEQSPRYLSPRNMSAIIPQLPPDIDKIGVFVNTDIEAIAAIANTTGLTGVQLHGDESPEFCLQLRQHLPKIELIKALRIKDPTDLDRANNYSSAIDTLLLDAYHPHQRGGTGKTLDWQLLQDFQSTKPWFLAGGLAPDNILAALSQINPNGIDLSSGVERSPGNKDLNKVAELFAKLRK
ncbi:phosphoribosylanthranilate isomerase [Spirulina sp. 06S082]|uniref:phosphoribosylanthranilate isomerase n=1 Tax=Spirulina sp. 06S082 TaxID=3110248 RepID=UPI002B21B595|nr:phosphoribosylanthranilate isomerase [Spirulina sp. 06S082]MEA5471023.1 phosphoribosylanthranilate isomerase [Spirulina sp. 06S082]